MKLSDISIHRPVFATVVSLLLIVLGVISFTRLPLRELPDIDPPVVSISTTYTGASAAVMETRVTKVLEDAVSGIEGVDTITSESENGTSRINIEFTLQRDIESAANDVRDAVSRNLDKLPDDAEAPQIRKVASDSDVIVWFNLSGPGMDTLALTDYAERYLVDRLSTVDGVAQVQLGGAQDYAMRIWIDRDALAARGLTIDDITSALRARNVDIPAGRLESTTRDFTLQLDRSFADTTDFEQLPIGRATSGDGHVVRLSEVARVELGSRERRAYYRTNGKDQVGLGIVKTSTANDLAVADAAKKEVAAINKTLPNGMKIDVTYDATVFIDVAVHEVYKTLAEAIALVLVVIWLFLGSARSALVPAVTVPVCVMAAFVPLLVFGFSINLLTLLALVLSIGLVVDDAIVVLENIQRRADLGEPPALAALRGTRQVAFAVMATTAVLVAVFLPIAFLQGNNGRLFRELAVALAGAVAISCFVALSLTPMMGSLLVRPHTNPKGISAWMEARLRALSSGYRRVLARFISYPLWFGIAMVAALLVAFGLFKLVPRELAPSEDRGSFSVNVTGPEGAGFDYTVSQMHKVEQVLMRYIGDGSAGDAKPGMRVLSRVPGSYGASENMNSGRGIVILKPWDDRDVSTDDVVEKIRRDLAKIPGVRAIPQTRQGLVRSGGQPLQVVLEGPDYKDLVAWRDRMLARMDQNPGLYGADADYKETRPQVHVIVDEAKAADLGVTEQAIGDTLQAMLGSSRVTTFVRKGQEYDVVLQAAAGERATPTDLSNLYVRSRSGALVPLASVVRLEERAEAGSLGRFNRLRAITLSAGLAPGYTLGEAIDWMRATAREELPATAQVDFSGQSREYLQSGSAVMFTFGMALLIVFLVLAAQFESFLHPLVIMLTVPLAVLGALLGLYLFGKSLNLFSQIGIVMLVGLAAKNGILIVEFANQRRDAGLAVKDAILDAAATRMRPILMTSIATIAGAMPLMLATGAGAGSRTTIGVVVVFGVALSTLLSLFVVPAFYLILAPYTRPPDERTRVLDQLDQDTPSAERDVHG
ncbi:efflux RND transporter permease subunit [Cognatiluteimonas telluris]|uniref:efflux RND transporter permease subunit n=1 Tax=Cognatiluteimonas telluris TaxID=1104775 RepID=UPI001408A99E|nr:efflux RND transporter permease subunit [Lysobacter telluris]